MLTTKRTCTVHDCDREQWSRTMCRRHYAKWLRTEGPGAACRAPDCDEHSYCRGYCTVHYQRVRTWGIHEIRTTPTLMERIWRKIDRQPDGCWNWLGTKSNGYGKITVRSLSNVPLFAHRLVYELLVEPIPDGHQIDHLCRNHSCVNPAHLEPVTPGENTRRAVEARKAGP